MQAADITRFKNQLIEMRHRLMSEITQMGEALTEDIQTTGDLSHVATHAADQDSEGLTEKIALERVEGVLLNEVNMALQRIEEGTFGRCEQCGVEIPRERLEALPYTRSCVGCEASREQAAEGP